MKYIALFMIALLLAITAPLPAQVSSNCTMPQVLKQAYERDLGILALRAMHQSQSPDTQLVFIPQSWKAPIAEGLAAIYNAAVLPERDSVFNIYCVHDFTGSDQTAKDYLVQIDTSYAWTQPWQNTQTLTGNAPLDAMLLQYGLHVTQYYDWSFGKFVAIRSDSVLNNKALIGNLMQIAGILSGSSEASIGVGGRITFASMGTDRFFEFMHQFGDCPAGCIDHYTWRFRVAEDCSVSYLGFSSSASWVPTPLPEADYCNLSSNIAPPVIDRFLAYPNPAQEYLQITAPEGNKEATTAELYDTQGRLVAASAKFQDQMRLDLLHLAHGIYSLVIKQQGLVMDVKHIMH